MLRPGTLDGRLLPTIACGRADPRSRFDECSYVSVFHFAEHTLVAEIFVAAERSFPFHLIVNVPKPARTDHDDRNDPPPDQQGKQNHSGQERWHESLAPRRERVPRRSPVGTAEPSKPVRGLIADRLWQPAADWVQKKIAAYSVIRTVSRPGKIPVDPVPVRRGDSADPAEKQRLWVFEPPITDGMASSAHSGPILTMRPAVWRQLLAALAVVCACACSLAAQPLATPGLPELVRTKHRTFAIPFRIPKSEDPDADAAPQKVVLNVSTDLGSSWQSAGEAAPTATSFTYRAETDGEYWFRLRALDKKGRSRGGEGPDIRVLVDAAGPRLAGRVWKGSDGEIVCRYAAADDSLRLESLKVEYRGPGDKTWKVVAAQAILARESPAHLVGEEIWWAGEKVETMTVKIAISDSSGNQTVKQLTLEPTDPQVDQVTLAKEIGVPPLPEQSVADGAAIADGFTTVSQPAARGPLPPHTAGGDWSAEAAGTWSDGQPQLPSGSIDGTNRSVLVRPANTSATPLLPRAESSQATQRQSLGDPGITQSSAGGSLEYRGRPLQLTKSRRFAWDYEIPAVRAAAGPLRAELWTTQDGGVTWQRTAVDNDGNSPIDVTLTAAGLYGVRLELVAEAGDESGGPRSGAAPEAWVGIDEEPPQVELVEISRDESAPLAALVIRYVVREPLIAPGAVRLLYSPNAEGPWATIADGVDNQGEHRWTPDRNVPAKVYVRVEAVDVAGNMGSATSPDPVSIATPRFGGKLGGLRPLP